MITQQQLDEAILTLTGSINWPILQQALDNEIYQCQAMSLDAKSWEDVCALRGYAKALAYVRNLREMTIKAKEQDTLDAAL